MSTQEDERGAPVVHLGPVPGITEAAAPVAREQVGAREAPAVSQGEGPVVHLGPVPGITEVQAGTRSPEPTSGHTPVSNQPEEAATEVRESVSQAPSEGVDSQTTEMTPPRRARRRPDGPSEGVDSQTTEMTNDGTEA